MYKLILVCGEIHFLFSYLSPRQNDTFTWKWCLLVVVNCRYSTSLGLDFSVLSQCSAYGSYRFLSYYLIIVLKLVVGFCLSIWFDICIAASIHVLPWQWEGCSFEAWCCERDHDGSSITGTCKCFPHIIS